MESKKERISFDNSGLPIQSILSKIKAFEKKVGREKLDLCPKYQRGKIWNTDSVS